MHKNFDFNLKRDQTAVLDDLGHVQCQPVIIFESHNANEYRLKVELHFEVETCPEKLFSKYIQGFLQVLLKGQMRPIVQNVDGKATIVTETRIQNSFVIESRFEFGLSQEDGYLLKNELKRS